MDKGIFAVVILLIVLLTLVASDIEQGNDSAVSSLKNFTHTMYVSQKE